MDAIEIRLCKTWDECVQCEELQREIWEMPDYRDVVPANLLITALKNGGLLVGAFQNGVMIGFAFGFLGNERAATDCGSISARLKHTSHMLGVLPNLRVHGLGAQMKWFQRAEAIKQGLDLMTWTYDPLQAVNAHLNFTRLGVIARRYIENAYGDMTDALNVGIASDRFEVEWPLTSARVARRQFAADAGSSPSKLPRIFELKWNQLGLPEIVGENELNAPQVLVEIPAALQEIKQRDRALAIAWRMQTRSVFTRAFAARYAAVDFLRETDDLGRARAFYVLEKSLV